MERPKMYRVSGELWWDWQGRVPEFRYYNRTSLVIVGAS